MGSAPRRTARPAAPGGAAFGPYDSNGVAGEAGTLWERRFCCYSFRREEFLKHSRQRSNAGSTFSMVKAKFRGHVRSRAGVALVNEVLREIVCRNLCVLLMSRCPLGIEPVFWQDEPTEKPGVLPLSRPG